jgi:hypothetical protein
VLPLNRVIGVDFSGAAKAGRNTWVADCEIVDGNLRLASVAPLERLAGTPDRAPALAYLSSRIAASSRSLWALDFPFGLPVELDLGSWASQLEFIAAWESDAPALGRHLVEMSRERQDRLHIRRATDVEQRTPFDCYHYRIIYQTFHGMRDVLRPVSDDPNVAVLPFQRSRRARSLVVEACPSSTLKRMGLPHQRYKQSTGGGIDPERRATRRRLVREIAKHVELRLAQRRRLIDNPGGDALDAVVAAAGAWHGWQVGQLDVARRGSRYVDEGLILA